MTISEVAQKTHIGKAPPCRATTTTCSVSSPTTPLVADLERVLAAAVTALLGPELATPDQVKAAAAGGIGQLAGARSAALDIISGPASAVSSP